LSDSPLYNVNTVICRSRRRSTIFPVITITTNGVKTMKRYIIERDLPGVGALNRDQLKGAAATSNAALAKLAGKVQWVESFVVDDKTFCVYLAEDEGAVREHAKLSGFPATKVTEVRGIIDPMTALG